MNNLLLWQETERTNPDDCKKVETGTFKYTAIDTYTRLKKATEMFGPFGIGWGLIESPDSYQVIQLNANAHHEAKLVYRADFWYKWDGERGQFPIVADIDLYFFSAQKGTRKNTEAWKKVKTDAITKGLSMLGFNTDVYMGLFEDQDYVATARAEFAEILRGADGVSHSHANTPTIQRTTGNEVDPDAEKKAALIESIRTELNGTLTVLDKKAATTYSNAATQAIKDILGMKALPKAGAPEIAAITLLQVQKLKEKVEAMRP